jgi:hypothetical protein
VTIPTTRGGWRSRGCLGTLITARGGRGAHASDQRRGVNEKTGGLSALGRVARVPLCARCCFASSRDAALPIHEALLCPASSRVLVCGCLVLQRCLFCFLKKCEGLRTCDERRVGCLLMSREAMLSGLRHQQTSSVRTEAMLAVVRLWGFCVLGLTDASKKIPEASVFCEALNNIPVHTFKHVFGG